MEKNSIPIKLYIGAAMATTLILIMYTAYIWKDYFDFRTVIGRDLRIKELSSTITYLDEVLTMSARMRAVTGDITWEHRYLKHEPLLDSAIKSIKTIAPHVYISKAAAQTDSANLKLVKMEKESFRLMNEGKQDSAILILFSPEYENEKLVYKTGNDKILFILINQAETFVKEFHRYGLFAPIISVVFLPIILLVWLNAIKRIKRYYYEREQAEEGLRRSAREWSNTFNAVEDATCLMDNEQKILRCNKAMTELFQKGYHEIVGHQCWEIVHHTTGPVCNCPFVRHKLSLKRESMELELNGKILDITTDPILDDQGKLNGTVHIIRDITERKQLELSLDEQRVFNETIINTTPDILYIYDIEERRNVFVNEGIQTNLGYSGEEIKQMGNQLIPTLMHPDDFGYYLNNTYPKYFLAKDGELVVHEYRMRDKSNNWHWLYCKELIYLRKKDGTPKQIYGIITDITKIKETENELRVLNEEYESINEELKQTNEELFVSKERAEESNRLKTAFLANLSHEIRTPMNAIIGFTDLLNEPDLSSEKRDDFINIIHKSGNYLLSVITDIVEIAKIDSKQVSINYSEFDINKFAGIIYDSMLVNLPKDKNIKFCIGKSNIAEGTIISTDEVKLKQIVLNLINNAFKYTPEGEVVVTYNFTPDNFLEIVVTDTGIGIPEKYHEMIFERFRQVELDNRVFQQGSGLGLSICKAYAEMMGGTISVKSVPDKGSAFTVSIPVSIVQKLPDKSEPVPLTVNSTAKIKILVAEDNEYNYVYIKEILSDDNFTLFHAYNGIEAIKILQEIPDIGLILLDIKMPVMDGYEALKEIRKQNTSIPIIAQTAYALSEDSMKIKSAGFDGYISKPIIKDDLLGLIEETMR